MKKQIAITLLTATILSSCSNNSQTKTETVTEEPKVEVVQEPVKEVPKDIEITKKDTAKTDELIFLVKNTNEPSIDRSGYSVTKPEDDEKYIAVQFWVKNISENEVTLDQEDFVLVDQDDADFVEKDGFTEHRKSPILFKKEGPSVEPLKFKPNETKSGWVTFTTSKTSKATKIRYKNITVKL
jgi:archaellum component FlaG (FlaF/FlaG flagellin family)